MLEIVLGAAVGIGAAVVVASHKREAKLLSPEQFNREFARSIGEITVAAACLYCSNPVSAENARILVPTPQGTLVICDRTECLLAFTQSPADTSLLSAN